MSKLKDNSLRSFLSEQVRTNLIPINEVAGVTYKFGCVMLYFDIPKDEWKKVQAHINDEDISEVDGVDGRETEPHVTILYGIHADVPDEDVEEIINSFKAPELTLSKIGVFENDDMDVVKFDIKSKELNAMNKKLKELPYTSKFQTYEPHSTIAFVKSGRGKDYTQTFSKENSITLVPDKIVYSKPDGTKKEYKFNQ